MARYMSSASAAAVMLSRSAIDTKTSAAVTRSIFDRILQQTCPLGGVFRSTQETYDGRHDSTEPMKQRATLHYVFDPLCGWCYAAEPLVEAARGVPGLSVEFHGGGMMTGPNRRKITPEWRDYVMPHDHRIAQLSGQPFGAAYFDGLLN